MAGVGARGTVVWDNPSQFQTALIAFGQEFPGRVRSALEPIASEGQAYMVANHPWNNQTGEAEAGLFGRVTGDGDEIVIEFGGTSGHQIYLELGTRYMAPRAIIMPTLHEFAGRALSAIRGAFGG